MSAATTANSTISPDVLNSECHGRKPQLVDVRSVSEFAAGHLPGAVNIPLDQLESRIADLDCRMPPVLICKTGVRSSIAGNLLQQLGTPAIILEGGTAAWAQTGFPLVASVRTRWSLERQVRLIAGLLVTAGALLALVMDPRWIYLSGFIGLGLTFAGLTDFCAMAGLLQKMPWNRLRKQPCPGGKPASRCCSQ